MNVTSTEELDDLVPVLFAQVKLQTPAARPELTAGPAEPGTRLLNAFQYREAPLQSLQSC